jgi:MoaA/NifB/PqqE/SkfB family radical SAM enzyme
MPSYLLLFVTGRCHASCRHCFYWKRLNRVEQELTLGEIDLMLRSLGTTLQVTVTGGSPELREDLAAILLTVNRHCHPLNITLCSNGNYPGVLRDALERALSKDPRMPITVDISLDGLNEEHDQIRGLTGLFQRAVQSFQEVGTLRGSYPQLRLGCGICVSGINSATALTTARWALEHLDLDNLTPVLVRGEPRDSRAAGGSAETFLAIAALVRVALESGALRGYSSFPRLVNAKDVVQKELIAEIAQRGKSPIRCSALRETVVVYPDGTVPVCEMSDSIIGNLRAVGMNLRTLWFGDAARMLRPHRDCACWHQCFLSASIVRSPLMWPRLSRAMIRQVRGVTAHV